MPAKAVWELPGVATPRQGSLADSAAETLLGWIMDGTLAPGESLPLAQIASALGISQTPLRESLARLEGQGLVVRLPMRGFRVAEPLSQDQLDSLMEARLVLEPAIARLAAVDAADADIEHLREVLTRSRTVDLGPAFEGYRAYLELSADFHDILSTMAANTFLQQALAALPIHVQRFRLFGRDGVNDRDVAVAEHQAILDAVASRDAEASASAMAAHILAVGRRSLSEQQAREHTNASRQ